MVAPIKWTAYAGIQTALSTGLNSLAHNASALSSAIDNSSNRYVYLDAEAVVTYGVAPAVGKYCSLYVVPSIDGTNYADFTSGTEPETLNVAFFYLINTTSAQRVIVRRIVLPPGLFKLGLKNVSGQTMAASGNTLKYNMYTEEL